MLSRIQSGSDDSIASSVTPRTTTAGQNAVANVNIVGGTGGDSQKMELFMQKLNQAMQPGMGTGEGVGVGGMGGGYSINASMGQRSRTVGAGLAYGRADMTTVNRMSRFNLGTLQKESGGRLSQLTTGGSTTGNTNQEWNLG
jgi:hypothetical protein